MCRVKFNLQFYIFCNGKKSASKFIHQYFSRFIHSINIGMITISFIGQFLHFIVFIISHTVAKYSKIYTALAFVFNQCYHRIITACTHIKITVCTKNNPVIPIFYKMFAGCFICQFYAFSTSR